MVKKFVTIITILALALSSIMPGQVFADEDIGYEGRICRDLGILKGETGVVDNQYLETRPSRLQAAIMFLRLKGLEKDALDYTGGNNFKDVGTVLWKEGRNLLSYLKDHPELGWIGDGVNFMPYSLIDSKAYYKVLLESLGYRQKIDRDGDFDWNSVLEFAEEKGLDRVAGTKNFTVRSLAIATVEALNTKMKNGRKTLIEYLVDIGDVDKRDAISLGLYSGELDAEVKYVIAISNSKVEVVFEESIEGSDAEDEDLYEIDELDIKNVSIKNEYSVIIDTSAMKENNTYILTLNDEDYSFRGLNKDKTAPKLIKTECKDTDRVELTFDRVLDNETSQNTDTYTISGANVISAELDSTNTKVKLTTSGIQSGRSYELKIRGIKNGDGVITKSITKRFAGKKDTSAPKLSKLTVLNNVRLLLEFSDSNGLDKFTAQDVSNYRITCSGGSLDVESAQVKDRDDDGMWDSVELVTESQESGKLYTLIIEDIKDDSALGNSITKEIKREFRGKAKDKSGPTVVGKPKAVTNTMVEIEFSDSNALDTESACDIDCYEIDDLDVLDARIKNYDDLYSSGGRTVFLTTSEMERSESYSLKISGIYDEFGNEMKSSSSNKTYRFKGLGEDRTPPYIISVQCIDSRTLELNFDNQLDEKSAENIINYRIDGLALVTKAVLQGDGKSVRLTVSSLSSDRKHTVMMNNIKDLSGNSLRNVKVDILYNGSIYDNDPPEVDYIDAVNREEVWIYFEEEVYAENAEMKASGISFRQVGSVLEDGKAVVMKASELMKDKEYEVTKLTGIWDLSNNPYKFEGGLEFYGTDNENEPPEVDYWDQMDVRRFRVVFTEPVLLKGNGLSGIKNPAGVSIDWTAVLNPDEEDTEEAYCTIDYIAVNKNIPPDREFKFNFTAMVSDYVGLGAYDEDDDGPGDSGSTILDSYMEDDEEPYIEYVEAITCTKVQVVFSEAIREPGRYKITYDDDDGRLRTIDIDFVEVDSEDNERVNIFTKDKMSDEYYYILKPQSAAMDIAGNKLDIDDLEIDFEGSSIMSSDYIQGVDLLNSNTFRVYKSSRIFKVSSLYELNEGGDAIGNNLIDSTYRVSSNVYKITSKKPLLKNVRYKISIDGLSYKFYGGASKTDYEPWLPDESSSKEITSFSFKNLGTDIIGSIDKDERIIRLTVPYGTDVKHLTASFKCSEHAVVKVGSKTQISGETTNDFSEVVEYTVIAQEGSTAHYKIYVAVEESKLEKMIKSFVFEELEPEVAGTIDNSNRIITMTLPAGTNLKALKPYIETSADTTVFPESGVANDFSGPTIYKVKARDGSVQNYTVVVTLAKELDKSIISFGFEKPKSAIAEIDEERRTIIVTVPYETNLKGLVPVIIIPENTEISPGSGKAQDFSEPVAYIVKAKDGTTRKYTVLVKRAPSSENLITAFAFRGLNPVVKAEVGIEQETIELTVPYGTDRTKLIASFRVSPEAVVKVSHVVQISGVTENDFTNPVKYTVMAQDGTKQDYTVTVIIAAHDEKKLTSFGFNLNGIMINAMIDEANHKIYATVPAETILKRLTAAFTYTGKSVKVGEVLQHSGITVNDFRKEIVYRVTAYDDSYVEYTVKVNKSRGGA